MNTIKNDPNGTNLMASDELPIEAVTVIDGSDRQPQWIEESGINRKSPSKLVHSETDQRAIPARLAVGDNPKRGKGGKMGKQWD